MLVQSCLLSTQSRASVKAVPASLAARQVYHPACSDELVPMTRLCNSFSSQLISNIPSSVNGRRPFNLLQIKCENSRSIIKEQLTSKFNLFSHVLTTLLVGLKFLYIRNKKASQLVGFGNVTQTNKCSKIITGAFL